MRILIDNTGLHAAGQCLSRRSTTEYDVRGLLQLATLIVFGSEIRLNGFEHEVVAIRSEEIRDSILDLGLDSSALEILVPTAAGYELACKTAAESAASGLLWAFDPHEHEVLGTEPAGLPQGASEQQLRFVELASLAGDCDRLRVIQAKALDDKGGGAVDYMMTICPELREAVARIMREHSDWSDAYSHQLSVHLRYHLNSALGERESATYSPAVGRAELIARRNDFVLESLSDMVDLVISEFRGSPLGVPSVRAALVARSKGDPCALVREAIEMRSKSAELRTWLGKLAVDYRQDKPEDRFEIRKCINELGHQFRQAVGLAEGPTALDGVEVTFVAGIPVPSVSSASSRKWLKHVLDRRRTVVLTDIARASAYFDEYDQSYAKLQRACREHS